MQNFIEKFRDSIRENWNLPALNDYRSPEITYGDMAREIEIMHILWKAAGLKRGDKISIYARNCSNWAVVFMAAEAGGYVATQLFSGFTPCDAQKLVIHSESRILYTEKGMFDKMNFDDMPELLAAIDIKSMELLACRNDFAQLYERRGGLFMTAHPQGLTPDTLHYDIPPMDAMSCLNYTSGSTGNPKGVMLTVGNISSNVALLPSRYPYRKGDRYLSMLPYAHIYGLVFDVLTCLCCGMHVTVLCQLPAPSILRDAFRVVRPRMIMMVPLVLEKVTEVTVGEFVHSKAGEERLSDPDRHPEFVRALREILMNFLGGNCELIFTGGTAIPNELETLLHTKLGMPTVTGYGMTECAPMISLGTPGCYKLGSCGAVADRMEVRIDSEEPGAAVGEVLVRGCNVFIGYYKNPEADRAVFTEDGWMRTGDLGTLDSDNNLFLVGRCKSMLLTTNGQNVYPEEIEAKLNLLPYVAESIIVQREERFVALIVPNEEQLVAGQVSADTLKRVMDKNIDVLNKNIPAYSLISDYEIMHEPFVKTPKGSIKRFMYS